MVVSAFTFVRNGLTYAYPFVESIKSLLPLVDEYIVVIGDSTDGTRDAVAAIGDAKIKIIDTVWDEQLRTGGKVFAQQANIGMDHCRPDADWLFHLQADEVLHEQDLEVLRSTLVAERNNPRIDGLLFPFIHFYGDYNHYCPTRRFHNYEIRVIRNNPAIRSYKDSMGFRKYNNPGNQDGELGMKLHAKMVSATIYHYSWARPPKKLTAKRIAFGKAYNTSDDFISELNTKEADGYSYREYDYLKVFTGTHPAVMQPVIAAQDWQFTYDPRRSNMKPKEHLLKWVEELTGKRLFSYKNYRIVRG
ncbi:Glycosyltransferase involved in cell wall bisynthesis [Cnuella takakiae]|uniref:Glycosyltransferase involved in cell wall bisynthesis n=1 Tax=Cnuella takakiae TaxID=1302690 RepID=A0A1M5GXG9_9BACT|nr:glycosyltransferase [Cnuella takakiae]OLY90852.1 hypothetical protein BUE76_02290 [Cnuella takakiae]SHG08414.1 Glycosyltransferase involved in cell wall bisynthesis [Cnuella takakiae]